MAFIVTAKLPVSFSTAVPKVWRAEYKTTLEGSPDLRELGLGTIVIMMIMVSLLLWLLWLTYACVV